MHIKVFGDSGRLDRLNDSTIALQARARKMTVWCEFWFMALVVVIAGLFLVVFWNREQFTPPFLIALLFFMISAILGIRILLEYLLSKDYGAISAIDVVEQVLSINANDKITREIADNQIRNAVIELLYRERGSGYGSQSAERQRVKARTLHCVFFELKIVDKGYKHYFQLAKPV